MVLSASGAAAVKEASSDLQRGDPGPSELWKMQVQGEAAEAPRGAVTMTRCRRGEEEFMKSKAVWQNDKESPTKHPNGRKYLFIEPAIHSFIQTLFSVGVGQLSLNRDYRIRSNAFKCAAERQLTRGRTEGHARVRFHLPDPERGRFLSTASRRLVPNEQGGERIAFGPLPVSRPLHRASR